MDDATGARRATTPLAAATGGRYAVAWITCLIAACFLAGWAHADDERPSGEVLLARMGEAMRNLDYQGSFTYQHAGRTDTLRVFHAGGPRERERLVSLSGPRTELVRDGFNVTCVQADGTATVYTRLSNRGLLPLIPDAGGRSLATHYDVRTVGSDRVAGFVADIVDVVARDRLRYGYRLWLDQQSHLLLRSIVTDADRRPLEQFMFVSLEVGSMPSETDLAPSRRELQVTTAPSQEVLVRTDPTWSVAELPTGFELVSARRSPKDPDGAEHLVYSDGLASVSIYVEPKGEGVDDAGALAGHGTMNIDSRVQDGWRITVLGDVPAETVGTMARSVVRKADSPGTP